MTKRYLVLSAGYNKETGEPYARMGAITEGVAKTGKAYMFTETDKTETLERFVPVGTVISYAMTEVTPDGEVVETTPVPENLDKTDKPDKPGKP
jgi:hypothetical protein